MSPNASWAESVMPTRTDDSAPSPGSPAGRTHSCSLVYFSSSGNTALLVLDVVASRLSGRSGLGVLRRLRLSDAGDPNVAEALDGDLAPDALHVGHEAAGEVQGGGQRVRVPDRVDDVRRLQPRPVDDHTTSRRVLQCGLGDHPHVVVDLDDLCTRIPELLQAVEELVSADAA